MHPASAWRGQFERLNHWRGAEGTTTSARANKKVMGMNHGQTQVNKAFVYSMLVILEQCPLGPGEGH